MGSKTLGYIKQQKGRLSKSSKDKTIARNNVKTPLTAVANKIDSWKLSL